MKYGGLKQKQHLVYSTISNLYQGWQKSLISAPLYISSSSSKAGVRIIRRRSHLYVFHPERLKWLELKVEIPWVLSSISKKYLPVISPAFSSFIMSQTTNMSFPLSSHSDLFNRVKVPPHICPSHYKNRLSPSTQAAFSFMRAVSAVMLLGKPLTIGFMGSLP